MNYTVYAAITALLLGAGNIIQKHGSLKYRTQEEFILSTATPNFLLGIIFIALAPKDVTPSGIAIITLAALLSAGVGRFFFQKAVYHDSSSVASAGSLTTEPTMSALLAAVFLGEKTSLKTIAAIGLIILSVAVSYRDIEVNKKAYLYGALSGFFAALSAVIIKMSYSHSIHPIFAAGWYLIVSAAYSTAYYAVKTHTIGVPRPDAHVITAYTMFGVAKLTSYIAFKLGPIANSKIIILTYPAIILVLSHALGYKPEKVTLKKYVSVSLSFVAAAIILS